ncbi:MAG: DsbA family oxidoreductase [Dermatophilaceae bacterium]
MADEEAGVVVDVWADLVDPWCFIGKQRLRAAVTAYERPALVRIRHRAYELDASLRAGERVPVAEYYARAYGGGLSAGRDMTAQVAEAASEDGLQLDFSRALQTSTFDAHRLVALAREMGGSELAQAALERFYAAHFQEGLALDDHGVLVRVGAEAGLDERRVASVLASDDYADAVRDDEARAESLGVVGLPFMLANEHVTVSGLRSVEGYLQMLREAAVVAED